MTHPIGAAATRFSRSDALRWRTTTRLLVLMSAVALAVACGGASSPSSPSVSPEPVTPTRAAITLSVSPSQITATCVTTASLCLANVALTFTEKNGLGANVTLITASLQTPNGTVAATASYDAAKITALAGSTHIPAFGSLAIPGAGVVERIGVLWSQANGVGRVGALTITVAGADDRGAAMSATVTIPVS